MSPQGKIEGPLSIRVNVWDPEKREFYSPSHQDFKWAQGGTLTIAQCVKTPTCPADPENEGLIDIQEHCRCGIYTSLNKDTLAEYVRSPHAVWFLVESWGVTHFYTEGLRSAAVEIVGVVNMENYKSNLIFRPGQVVLTKQNYALAAAADYFRTKIFSYGEARALVKYYWEKHGMTWQDDFLS